MGEVIPFPRRQSSSRVSVLPDTQKSDLENKRREARLEAIRKMLGDKEQESLNWITSTPVPLSSRVSMTRVPNAFAEQVVSTDPIHKKMQSLDLALSSLVNRSFSEHNADVLAKKIMELTADALELGRHFQAMDPDLDFEDGR